MAKREVKNLNIPPEAIRTMRKDLAGITRGEWELTLAEAEIEILLRKFQERQGQEDSREKMEEERKKKEEQRKREKIEKPKEEKEEIIKEKPTISEKETEIVEEIRKRAKRREEMVKTKMQKEAEKVSAVEEIKIEQEEKERKEEELNKRKKELKQALEELPKEKEPLEESKVYYLRQSAEILKDLEPILESEKKIEENVKFIEGIERTAITPRQKKKAEQERQLAEQEREVIEKQRWDHEQKKFKVDKQLKEVDFGFQQIAQKEAKIKQEIEDIEKELGKIAQAKERAEIEKKIAQLLEEKKEYSKAKEKVLETRKNIEEKLAEVINREQKIEKETGHIQSEERLATETEKERVEKERWKLEKIRSGIEKERWLLEEEERKIRLEENRINVHYDRILEQENQLRTRVQEINKLLGIVVPEKEITTPSAEVDEFEKRNSQKKELESEKQKIPIQPIVEDEPKESEKETTETGMTAKKEGKEGEKNIEQEPKSEREEAQDALKKIEAKRKREVLLKKLRMRREEDSGKKERKLLQRIRQGTVMPPAPAEELSALPRRSRPLMDIIPTGLFKTPRARILIIAILALVIAGIITFWYWYARIREDSSPPPIPPVTPDLSTTTPAMSPPPDLVSATDTIPIEIESTEQALAFVAQIFLNQNLPENKFTRILIKDTKENEYLGIRELFPSLKLSPPQTLYSQIDNQATFYVFSTENYNILGFAAESSSGVSKGEIETIMKSWEKTLLQEIKNLGSSLGVKNIIASADFQETDYKNHKLRYLTLVPAPDCYGACYSVIDNLLIFGTCCNPITEILNGLDKEETDPLVEEKEPNIVGNILTWGYRTPTSPRTIDTIVLHSSYDALGSDPYSTTGVIEEYRLYGVASHYLIARDGTIYRLAPDEAIAYHAGVSTMPDKRTNANDFSIGIELIYTKSDAPTEIQYQASTQLVKYLRSKYNVPLANIVSHAEISPTRENDPANFDWEKLKQSLE